MNDHASVVCDNIYLDDPYTVEQLNAPSMIVARIQPLVDEFYNSKDITTGTNIYQQIKARKFKGANDSIVYCLLVNRVQFLREQSNHAHHESVNVTRAALCEAIASKILQRVDEDNPGSKGLLLLAHVLVESFDPFQGIQGMIVQGRHPRKYTVLELGILSESKLFMSSSACQKVVKAIQKGRVVYTPSSPFDLLPDRYDLRPISLYEPRTAPLLNHYRLIVPRIRNVLEVCQFVLLLVFYVLVMVNRDPAQFDFDAYELVFCFYTFGWVLDQFASILEHGWRLYTRNLWSFLDVAFAVVYGIYLVLRLCSVGTGNVEISRQALDILSMGAPILVPRLAFSLFSENMLFVSIRAMMADFSILSLLAVWCSAGFLLAMTWLSRGLFRPTTISKWMLWVWFAMDGTGIERSVELHWLLGPTLMIAFAFLGNTLFLTILVAMLSNTFSKIVSDATVENHYRRAVMTFAAVKSDAIFAYQPPFNILALCLMLPLKFLVSPRYFHKANVAASRTLNAPLLLLIGLYERSPLWQDAEPTLLKLSKPRSKFVFWAFSKLYGYDDVRAVFDYEPSLDELSDTANLNSCTEDD